jgi:hypothetical protein
LLERDALELKRLGGIVTPGRPDHPPLFKVAIAAQHLQKAGREVFATLAASAAQWRTAGGEYFVTLKVEDEFLRVFPGRRSDLEVFLEDICVDAERQIAEVLVGRADDDRNPDEAAMLDCDFDP